MEKMKLKTLLPVLGIIGILMIAGCGASKTYVDQAVAGERARSEAALGDVKSDLDATKAEIDKLQSLTAQLEKKTDMAINEAKGFENYQVIGTYTIYFDFNSSEINPEAQVHLDQAGDQMHTHPGAVAEIAGHCDPTGPAAYNMELGNERASAAKYYLVDNFGINLYRMFIVSHGEKKAVPSGDGNVSYADQRKVVIKVWGNP